MIATKKALQEQVEKLEYENDQFRFALKYLAFDLEATRRERDGVKAQVVLLREELADLKQALENGGLIG
jgi:chromosome segregation ATPase